MIRVFCHIHGVKRDWISNLPAVVPTDNEKKTYIIRVIYETDGPTTVPAHLRSSTTTTNCQCNPPVSLAVSWFIRSSVEQFGWVSVAVQQARIALHALNPDVQTRIRLQTACYCPLGLTWMPWMRSEFFLYAKYFSRSLQQQAKKTKQSWGKRSTVAHRLPYSVSQVIVTSQLQIACP